MILTPTSLGIHFEYDNMNTQNLIWGLEELSDRDRQECLWLGKSEGEIGSFEEAVASTFDDSGLGRILDSGEESEELSAELREMASQLHRLVKKVPYRLAPLDTISHPAMNAVRGKAKEMLRILKSSCHRGDNP